MAPALTGSTPVWVRANNAYYKSEFVRHCAERGWDYSVSVNPRRVSAAHCGPGGIAGCRDGLAGHRSGRIGDDRALSPRRLEDAKLRGGAAAPRWPAALTDPGLYRHPGLPRRSGRGGVGPAPSRQARLGERLQGAVDRPGPASSALPAIPGQPGVPCLWTDRPVAVARGAVSAVAGRHSATWVAPADPPLDPHRGPSRPYRPALAVGLRQIQLPPRLVAPCRLATRMTRAVRTTPRPPTIAGGASCPLKSPIEFLSDRNRVIRGKTARKSRFLLATNTDPDNAVY